jgi:hypothetical protein
MILASSLLERKTEVAHLVTFARDPETILILCCWCKSDCWRNGGEKVGEEVLVKDDELIRSNQRDLLLYTQLHLPPTRQNHYMKIQGSQYKAVDTRCRTASITTTTIHPDVYQTLLPPISSSHCILGCFIKTRLLWLDRCANPCRKQTPTSRARAAGRWSKYPQGCAALVRRINAAFSKHFCP